MRGLAVGRQAAADVAGFLAAGRAAADAAEAVPAVPMQDAAGIGEERALGPREERPDSAEIGELDRALRADRVDRSALSVRLALAVACRTIEGLMPHSERR